jgi:2-methylisocitrate lyase-like PEP mutase family enzyme
MSAKLFRELHQGPAALLLANAWDAGTARLIESLGAKAIATTSAGLAWSRGYADGNALPTDELLAVVRDITRVIRVPLTIDIEAGYSQDPSAVGQLATRVAETGAVGINIEDGAGSPELLCTKIDAIRRATSRSGTDLFINTRTDVYLRGLASGQAASVAEVIRRAALYRAAGCDGLFVPGLADVAGMAAIAGAIGPVPLNIMAVPGLPALEVLVKNGVRRLSAGSAIAQAALGCTSRLAENFLAGTMSELFTAVMPYGAANQLFADQARA